MWPILSVMSIFTCCVELCRYSLFCTEAPKSILQPHFICKYLMLYLWFTGAPCISVAFCASLGTLLTYVTALLALLVWFDATVLTRISYLDPLNIHSEWIVSLELMLLKPVKWKSSHLVILGVQELLLPPLLHQNSLYVYFWKRRLYKENLFIALELHNGKKLNILRLCYITQISVWIYNFYNMIL